MGTIWTMDPDDCKPRGNVLAFPSDPLAPPPAVSLREMARMVVADWRGRKERVLGPDQILLDNHNDEEAKPLILDTEATAMDPIGENGQGKSGHAQNQSRTEGLQTSANGIVTAGEVMMRELNPPLMTDAERGQGDSTNARMHRIISGRR